MKRTVHLAEHVVQTHFSELPDAAVSAARIFFLDTLGVGIAGAQTEFTSAIRNVAQRFGRGDQASVLGSNLRLPASGASFVNGYQIHCQEFDCVHEAAVVHPLATIFSSLMAEAEQIGAVSGKDFIIAMVLAIDVAAGLGLAAPSALKFFRPATAGIFGATAGIAKLRRYTEEQLMNSWGYALAQSSGSMQAHVEGKPALPVQIGNAARGAHMACDLVRAGVPGPEDSLEGAFGYLSLYEDEIDWKRGFGSLGSVWRIAEISHKPYPTGRAAHGGLKLIDQLMSDGLGAANLDSMTISAPPIIHRLVGRPYQPSMTVNYARLCFSYLAATALLKGSVSLEDFTASALADPQKKSLAQRIRIEIADGAPSDFTPQKALARLKDGSELTASLDVLPGSIGAPLSRDQYLEKFYASVRFGMPSGNDDQIQELVNTIDQLENVKDVGALARAFV